MVMALGQIDDVQTISVTKFKIIRANADRGPVRIKSLHLDMVFSPAGSATTPVVVDVTLHRVPADLGTANLVSTEGTRVKYERLTVGRSTDRYYRMWFEAINIEHGYHIILAAAPVDIVGGTPTWALGGRWWELINDAD